MHNSEHCASLRRLRLIMGQVDGNPDGPGKISLIFWQPDRPNLSGGLRHVRPDRKAVL